MEHYLEYLRKLQKEMKLDEKVDYDELEEYQKLRSKYNNLASLFGFISITVALSTVFVAHYSRIGAMVVMLVAFGFLYFVIKYGDKTDRYGELSRNERDKVYNVNHSVIKNAIIEDGDEHMKQLVTWWRMCELSDEDEEKYTELLRIIHDVCREYTSIWR